MINIVLTKGAVFNYLIKKKRTNMAIMKVIEIMADSKKSWEDATANAVKKASKSVNNIKSAYVQNQNVVVKDGKISAYRVNVKLTFEVG